MSILLVDCVNMQFFSVWDSQWNFDILIIVVSHIVHLFVPVNSYDEENAP